MLILRDLDPHPAPDACDGAAPLPLLFDPRGTGTADRDGADKLLLDGLAARHLPSLDAMHARYAPSVYGLCLYLTGSRADADLLLAAAFYRFWMAAPSLRVPRGGTLGCLLRFAFLCRPHAADVGPADSAN